MPSLTRNALIVAGCSILAAASISAHAAAGRTFVSTTGSDGNTAVNCNPNAPCRTFAAALSATTAGGEVVVLTSGGYGSLSITQSVVISAAPGVYAAISATSGDAININVPDGIVALNGLVINGNFAAANGINVVDAYTVSVHNCTIVGTTGNGILFAPPSPAGNGIVAGLLVTDSRIFFSTNGINVSAATGSTAGAYAAVSNSRLARLTAGVRAGDGGRATIQGGMITNVTNGIVAAATDGTARVHLERSVINSVGGSAVQASTTGVAGDAQVTLKDNSIDFVNAAGIVFDGAICANTGACRIVSDGRNMVTNYTTLESPGGIVTAGTLK
jgi:hypothetical protein